MMAKLELLNVNDDDVRSFVSIYNTLVSTVHPFKYNLSYTKSRGIRQQNWYKDVTMLMDLIHTLKTSPRNYILSQLTEYKKPNAKARLVPTLKMMASEKGIERYITYCRKVKQVLNVHIPTQDDLDLYASKKMSILMDSNDIKNVEDFFKDIFLSSQLSSHFVQTHPTYLKLRDEGYYRREFGSDFPFVF